MKKRRVKGLVMVLIGLLSLGLLAGCGTSKLSEAFNEEEVRAKTEEVITMLNNQDTEGILEISTAQMKQGLTEEIFEEIYETLREGGGFKEIGDMSIAGEVDEETDQEFAMVVAKAQYETRSFVYTITFNTQMQLAGLYYR